MKRLATLLALAVWLCLVAVAFQPLLAYQAQPGKQMQVNGDWPRDAELPRTADGAMIVMFVHPLCPCSAASLNGLDRLSAKVGENFRAVVMIEQPANMDAAWADSENARHAARIKGVKVVIDKRQVEAARFGATTSGDTFVYGADGKLLFHGGITPGRGHEGDCAGFDTVCSILRGSTPARSMSTPSFGCALFNH